MSEPSTKPQRLRTHSTSLVYATGSGQVLHISHVEVMEGVTPPPEFLSEIERNALDQAFRIHGVPRDNLAILSIDPKDYRPNVVYSVDVATRAVKTSPITRTRGTQK
jgi:hypothetical protein